MQMKADLFIFPLSCTYHETPARTRVVCSLSQLFIDHCVLIKRSWSRSLIEAFSGLIAIIGTLSPSSPLISPPLITGQLFHWAICITWQGARLTAHSNCGWCACYVHRFWVSAMLGKCFFFFFFFFFFFRSHFRILTVLGSPFPHLLFSSIPHVTKNSWCFAVTALLQWVWRA